MIRFHNNKNHKKECQVYIKTLWLFLVLDFVNFKHFKIRFYIKCGLKVNLLLSVYMYFYLEATVKTFYHDNFNN